MTNTATNVDEFKAVLTDKSQLADLLANGGSGFAKFVTDSVDEIQRRDESLMAQVREQTQATIADMLRANGKNKAPLNFNPKQHTTTTKGSLFNKAAVGAALDATYQGSAHFFQANWHQRQALRNAEELEKAHKDWRQIQNSFSSVVPDAGGFLIPEELRSEILQNSLEEGIVRQRATVLPMSSLTLDIPAVDETTHNGSVFGGVVAYWTEEGASLTESQASFGRVKLEASKLVIYSEAPNELIADAPAFGALLDQVLPAACAFFEDDGFINGNGVDQPLGVLKGSGVVSVTRTTGATIKFQDIVNMYTRMLPSSINKAVWLVSPDALVKLLSLVMPTGDATTTFVAPPLWLNNGVAGAPFATILGRPLIVSEKIPALGSQGDLSFVDFSQYLIGDRQAMTLTSSPHYKFASDKTAFRITERVDGRPWMQSAITPKNGSSNTLSPYVVLN